MAGRVRESSPYASESAEQIAVLDWWGWQYRDKDKLLFAIPNGGHRNKITAARLKREGVKTGVADLFLAIPYGGFHGAFIEMKRTKGGQQSEQQKIFQIAVEAQGYLYIIAHGSGEAISKIESYLRGEIRAIPRWRRNRGEVPQLEDKPQKIVPDEEWLSVQEVCKLMDISPPTVVKLIKDGTVLGRHLGRQWIINKRSILEYINRNTVSTWRKTPGRKRNADKADSGEYSLGQSGAER